jgi:phosphoribosyl-ATP pyrophosphohydrolase/phosphoribosyl-AMP cyclohydrolase
MDGKAVQLRQGRDKILEREDPVSLAREFDRYSQVAVVDLDAALGKGENESLIARLCDAADCRVGGGIRSLDKAVKTLNMGARKIIVGTSAFCSEGVNHEFLTPLAERVGPQQVIIAVDAYAGEVVVEGWRKRTGLSWESVIKELEPYASEFLVTSVEKEGMMQGAPLESYRSVQKLTRHPVTAAGGITTLEEIAVLAEWGINSQIGMALYTGTFSLPAAFSAALKWNGGLLPTVTVDEANRVLMLAYSSRDSLEKTFSTGHVWYYSRSRRELWQKGETSGNTQKFLKIRTDCDGDALLITADPAGPACHTGSYSCFGPRAFTLEDLYRVIQDRIEHPTPGSYTGRLTPRLLREKILEEAGEVVEAREPRDIIWEVSDLVYFISVLMAKHGVSWQDILGELGRRRRRRRQGGKDVEAGQGDG